MRYTRWPSPSAELLLATALGIPSSWLCLHGTSFDRLLWITLNVLISQEVEKSLEVRSLYEVPGVVLPVKDRLGHRFVVTSQKGPRINGLYLDIEGLQFFLKRLGEALQGMLAREIGPAGHQRGEGFPAWQRRCGLSGKYYRAD